MIAMNGTMDTFFYGIDGKPDKINKKITNYCIKLFFFI
jgi:hypothetical protein